jgi:hypothetical protein
MVAELEAERIVSAGPSKPFRAAEVNVVALFIPLAEERSE